MDIDRSYILLWENKRYKELPFMHMPVIFFFVAERLFGVKLASYFLTISEHFHIEEIFCAICIGYFLTIPDGSLLDNVYRKTENYLD